jgi:hypothetical protein
MNFSGWDPGIQDSRKPDYSLIDVWLSDALANGKARQDAGETPHDDAERRYAAGNPLSPHTNARLIVCISGPVPSRPALTSPLGQKKTGKDIPREVHFLPNNRRRDGATC